MAGRNKGIEPEFFKSDGDLYTIRSLGGVKVDVGLLFG